MPRARVLAVDDQRYFRELIEGLLTEEGYEVVTAATGDEALHVLERADFEIIVTDLVMPGMDGVELVRRIKERKPDQEIVMVTGVSDVNSAIEAMKQGATDYLLKPLDGGLLASSLDDILQRRRIAEEHSRLMTENEEYLGALALYERAAGLFSTLAVQPLGERCIEGLCLETHAQGGVLWAASGLGEGRLQLVAARGIIRVDDEPRELVVSRLGPELQSLVEGGGPIVTNRRADTEPGDRGGSALFVPLRHAGELIGLARLSDKLEGEDFSDSDTMRAQAFTRFGELALGNALRFRELERRSLLDPRSGAYTHAYFEDVVRNEIQKANRFGRPFSIARIHLGQQRAMRQELGEPVVESWRESMVHHISRVLRSTDLLCAGNDGHFSVMLPETDSMAGSVLLQRMRDGLKAEGVLEPVGEAGGQVTPQVSLAVVTYPTDGTQLESLLRTLEARIVEQRSGGARSREAEGATLADTIQGLALRAEVVSPHLTGQVLDFLIDEASRRPSEQGLLFVAPGSDWRAVLGSRLDTFCQTASRTQLVVAAKDASVAESSEAVTLVSDEGLGSPRLCLLYWGERPAYALVAGEPTPDGAPTAFHTADRALVEQLAIQLRRDLPGLPELDIAGGAE